MKLNTAIVGLGPHGKRLLKTALEKENLKVVALVDQNHATFSELELNGISTYLDTASLFSDHKVDFYIITTNGPSHYTLAKEAIKNGVKRIMVSKPLACTLQEAKEMVKLAEENNVRLAVDHGLRYDKTYNWLKEKIMSGKWGVLRSVYVMRNGIGLGCLGIHSFDLVNFLADSPVKTVVGWVDKPIRENPRGKQFIDPGGLVVLNYENGVRGIISQIEDGAGPMSVEINLTRGRIRVNEKFREIDIVTKDPEKTGKPGKPVPYEKIEIPKEIQVRHDIFELMKGILDELAGETSLKCDARDGQNSLEILVAAYLSSERGNIPVELPLIAEVELNKFLPIT